MYVDEADIKNWRKRRKKNPSDNHKRIKRWREEKK